MARKSLKSLRRFARPPSWLIYCGGLFGPQYYNDIGGFMRHTIETARQAAVKKGYVILSDEWTNKRTEMLCLCKCGNKCNLTMKAICRGSKCKNCQYTEAGGKKGFAGRLKLTHDNVSLYFKEQNCELLEEYKGCQTPMLYRCSCGNTTKIRWDHFKSGIRCGCIRKETTITLEQAKQVFKDNGCELLATEYSSKKMPYKCKCGRSSSCSYTTMRTQKIHCRECGKEKNRGSNSSNYIKDRESLKYRNKFKKRCYKMIEHTLNMTGKKKDGHTYDLLGYSPKMLQQHIESDPNWASIKNSKWHLDHIFPIKAFVDHGIHDIKIINSLDNLQPITQRENNIKKDKYDKDAFKAWLLTKGIVIK